MTGAIVTDKRSSVASVTVRAAILNGSERTTHCVGSHRSRSFRTAVSSMPGPRKRTMPAPSANHCTTVSCVSTLTRRSLQISRLHIVVNTGLAMMLENVAIQFTGAAEPGWLTMLAMIRAATCWSEVGLHRLR